MKNEEIERLIDEKVREAAKKINGVWWKVASGLGTLILLQIGAIIHSKAVTETNTNRNTAALISLTNTVNEAEKVSTAFKISAAEIMTKNETRIDGLEKNYHPPSN